MASLNNTAQAAIEDAFKEGVKERFDTLCGNLSGGTAEAECFDMFAKSLRILLKAREVSLAIVNRVMPRPS